MLILKLVLQSICLSIFFITSAYVFVFGKRKSGLHLDYFITTIMLILILWRLS